ncbi:MAG: hypothetical protein Q4C14_07625 [Bacillota bacterium]|nr:hypothetical protein [Bacillota bacterium]
MNKFNRVGEQIEPYSGSGSGGECADPAVTAEYQKHMKAPAAGINSSRSRLKTRLFSMQ